MAEELLDAQRLEADWTPAHVDLAADAERLGLPAEGARPQTIEMTWAVTDTDGAPAGVTHVRLASVTNTPPLPDYDDGRPHHVRPWSHENRRHDLTAALDDDDL